MFNMICPNCKAEISDDSRFCIKCGTKLQEMQAAAENSSTAASVKPADNNGDASGVVCSKCGHAVKAGMKFCTKCGAPVDESTPVKKSFEHPDFKSAISERKNAAAAPSSPAPAPAPAPIPAETQPEPEKSHSKGLIFIIILVIIALIVAILLVLKSTGLLSRGNNDQNQNVQTSSNTSDEDTPNEGEGEDDPEPEPEPEPEEDPEVVAARLAEIEQIKSDIDAAVKTGDESQGINEGYTTALDGYITLATDYELADEVSGDALKVFDKYTEQVRFSVSLLDGQKVSSGLYIQSMVYYDDLVSYASNLHEAGYDIDVDKVSEERASLRETYRIKYINAINEISSRENWSRDEAWELMADAASILDDDGNPVLFDEDDLDDPLRLRYIYSLAWATRKHLETGFADKSITAEEALDTIDELLPETDYNLQLLFDAIYYAGKAGVDAAPYEDAFNAIMEKIGENQGITIIMDHAKADETHIDLNHFWAFNDISPDADPDIQVSTTNGTTAETRAWIRDNIRVSR
jgi:hypothetical protein